LQGMVWTLLAKLMAGQAPQFIVDKGQNPFERLSVPISLVQKQFADGTSWLGRHWLGLGLPLKRYRGEYSKRRPHFKQFKVPRIGNLSTPRAILALFFD
jgi:hypothetical protein